MSAQQAGSKFPWLILTASALLLVGIVASLLPWIPCEPCDGRGIPLWGSFGRPPSCFNCTGRGKLTLIEYFRQQRLEAGP